jgi:hypothetical protein
MQMIDTEAPSRGPDSGNNRARATAASRDRNRLLGASNSDDCLVTHSAAWPRAADGCIAQMMRKPNRAGPTSDAALLLLWGFGLLARHVCSVLRPGVALPQAGLPGCEVAASAGEMSPAGGGAR